jgi:hypothetical protein
MFHPPFCAFLMCLQNGNHAQRQGSSGSTTPSERGPRGANGTHARPSKSTPAPPPKQRVPNADEFPVLGGSSTPPQVNGHVTHTGPTAAQVLQTPAVRKDPPKPDASTSVTEGQEQFRPIVSQVRAPISWGITQCADNKLLYRIVGRQDRLSGHYHIGSRSRFRSTSPQALCLLCRCR